MTSRDTTLRALHDLGLAAWFGGSLFGVTGLNTTAAEASDPVEGARVASVGWAKWSPVNTAAIALHAAGGIGLLLNNSKRVRTQRGTRATAYAKAATTVGAVGASIYARVLGKKIEDAVIHASPTASSSSTSHASTATTRGGASSAVGEAAREADKQAGRAVSAAAQTLPGDARDAAAQLRRVQWLIPALTGAALVFSAQAGEQQRPTEQLRDLVRSAGDAVGVGN